MAAEKYAEQLDSGGDYDYLNGSDEKIHVHSIDGKEKSVFEITAETVSNYTAREVE